MKLLKSKEYYLISVSIFYITSSIILHKDENMLTICQIGYIGLLLLPIIIVPLGTYLKVITIKDIFSRKV